MSSWLNGQKEYQRMGNSHPNIAPYSVYRTRDNDYIVIGVATDSQFEKLCEILGMDTSREDFKLNKGRCAQRDRLNAEI
jgi:crotonobetainyl-CoA:carnitine CoA-transferase CaiB-like acyl-CoA transferase